VHPSPIQLGRPHWVLYGTDGRARLVMRPSGNDDDHNCGITVYNGRTDVQDYAVFWLLLQYSVATLRLWHYIPATTTLHSGDSETTTLSIFQWLLQYTLMTPRLLRHISATTALTAATLRLLHYMPATTTVHSGNSETTTLRPLLLLMLYGTTTTAADTPTTTPSVSVTIVISVLLLLGMKSSRARTRTLTARSLQYQRRCHSETDVVVAASSPPSAVSPLEQATPSQKSKKYIYLFYG